MATYGSLVNRVIEELPRSDASITAIVQQNMLSAIEFYTPDRFWFNEKQTTLTTSSSLAYYSWPTDMMEVDSIVAFDTGGKKYPLDAVTFANMEYRDIGGIFGMPVEYSTYNKQFRLYPVPNATYTFIVSHQYAPATLSASTESNVWTVEAQDLIRNRTLKLCSGRFKNYEAMAMYQNMENQEYARLKEQTEKLLGTGSLEGSGL